MAANEYEPSDEQVEADALRVHATYKQAVGYTTPWDDAAAEWRDFCRAEAKRVLRRQHERESGLLATLRRIAQGSTMQFAGAEAQGALNHHAKLDAPKVPTVAECEKRLRDLWGKAQGNRIDGPLSDALDAWKAAVEREEKNR